LRVLDLSFSSVEGKLKNEGLIFKIGFSVVCLKSALPNVAKDLATFYAFYELAGDDAFIDFYITLDSSLLRRWFKPQANFSFDGFHPFKPLPQNQSFAMFEWGFNWVVAQNAHQYLILHSAVVEKNGKAFIFPGTPGSGKSTLCAAMVSRGWRLLSDEMALLNIETGLLQPIPRPISLKNESINIIGRFAPDFVIGEAVYDTAKGTVAHVRAPEDSVTLSAKLVFPSAIVFPKYKKGARTELVQITKGVAFMKVAENSFNYSVLGEIAFDILADTVERCDCFEFRYQDLPEAIDLFDSMVAE